MPLNRSSALRSPHWCRGDVDAQGPVLGLEFIHGHRPAKVQHAQRVFQRLWCLRPAVFFAPLTRAASCTRLCSPFSRSSGSSTSSSLKAWAALPCPSFHDGRFQDASARICASIWPGSCRGRSPSLRCIPGHAEGRTRNTCSTHRANAGRGNPPAGRSHACHSSDQARRVRGQRRGAGCSFSSSLSLCAPVHASCKSEAVQ